MSAANLLVPDTGTRTLKACICGCQTPDEHRRNWDVRQARSVMRYGVQRLQRDGVLRDRLALWSLLGMLPSDVAAAYAETEGTVRIAPLRSCAAPDPTTLYRLYGNAFGDRPLLLYIGIAGNPGRRFEQHAAREWWGDVQRVDLEHFPTRAAALCAESEAIRREAPIHNKTHNQQKGDVH